MNVPSSKITSKRAVQRIRVRAILFLFLALAAGLGAVYLVNWYMNRMQHNLARTAIDTTPVVVADLDIPIGTLLTEQHLAVVRWPTDTVPEGSFDSVAEVLDRTLEQSAIKGEPILGQRLVDPKAGRGLRALLTPGTRAMTVKVDQVVGVAGFIQPNDRVDVITTMAPDEETKRKLRNEAAKVSKIILQNIKVLAIGEQIATDASKPIKVQVVTLEVNPEQSERLALASLHGDIQLTMRSRIDLDAQPTYGITPVTLLSPDKGAKDYDEITNRQMAARQAAAKAQAEKPSEPKAPEEPLESTVEILRGNRIEERKLRPTADSENKEQKTTGGTP
jgi:pilus assembly protein CpaB